MADDIGNLPADARTLFATLRELRRQQGDRNTYDLLGGATADLSFDGSDFGVDYFTLNIELPLAAYAVAKLSIDELEASLAQQMRGITKGWRDAHVNSVVIVPQLVRVDAADVSPLVDDMTIERIWTRGRPRLFLSHISRHKAEVGSLKSALEARGTSAFAAHKDIKPTLAWQSEIESALQTMDVMVALLTDGFHESDWTDQEVGFALGRGVFVLSVKLGAAPYGFIGRHQALAASFEDTGRLADAMVALLLARQDLSARMTEGLVQAIESASSFADSRTATTLLNTSGLQLSQEQAERLATAIDANRQVRDSTGVPGRISSMVERQFPGVTVPSRPTR